MKLHVRPSVGFDKVTDRSHTSPLHLAAQTGAILCLKWLIQCGAAINRQDFMGETALHKAAKAGNTDSAAMLVSHGSMLDLKNHRRLTPTHLAELANHPALAQFLRRCSEQQPHSYSQSTKIPQISSLPISDLNMTAPSLPSPASMSLHSPFIIPPSFTSKNYDEESKSSGNNSDASGCMSMNGDEMHQSMCDMRRYDGEFMSSESLSSGSSQGYGENTEGSVCLSNFGGMKRSLADDDDDNDDDNEDTMQGMDDLVSYPDSKRRCFVSSPEYGTTNNNNVLSSYNAILAMSVEPLQKDSASPTGIGIQSSSSAMEHQASVVAEQGYDSSLMNSFNNVFM